MRTYSSEPWTRQPGETAKAHAAFLVYRNLGAGRRSLNRAYNRHRTGNESAGLATPGTWTHWSVRHDWARRCAAWDAHVAREEDTAAIRYRRRVQERHEAQIAAIVDKVIAALEKMDFSKLRPGEYVRAVERVILLSRLIHMEPITGTPALETAATPALPAAAAVPRPETAPLLAVADDGDEVPALLPLPQAKPGRRARDPGTPRRAAGS
jgi:hypothetical protein